MNTFDYDPTLRGATLAGKRENKTMLRQRTTAILSRIGSRLSAIYPMQETALSTKLAALTFATISLSILTMTTHF